MHSHHTTIRLLLVGTVVVLTAITGVAAGANALDVEDSTASVDERTQITVSLDQAPDGVQRYNLTVALGDSSVASIESAAAGDVEGFQVRSRTDDAVTFRAADLSEGVEPGASDVTLGTITLATTTPGTSSLTVSVHDFQNDDGEQITPSVNDGTLTVQGGAAAGDGAGPGPVGWLDRHTAGLPGSGVLWAGAVAGVSAVIGTAAIVRRWR